MQFTWIGKLAAVSLLTLVLGCKPPQPRVYSGNAELIFLRATPAQLQFRISNQSGRVVRFRGSPGDDLGADPWDFFMECKPAEAVEWDVRSPGVMDGNTKSFEVAPGEELFIRVSNDFASRYKNGRCRMTLWLRDKMDLTSDEFEP